jgi:hypothetical protein
MVIGINRFNELSLRRAVWRDRLPYGTTAVREAELAAEVERWQRAADLEFPGVVTVVGHMLDPPVRDGERLVDADVLRHLLMGGQVPQGRRFPFAGVRQALVGGGAALARLRELWRYNDEVFVHIGDGDVVSLASPAGGGLSVLGRYRAEIEGSRADGPSSLVRLGGGYEFSADEVDYGPRGVRPPGAPVSDAAKLTLVFAEADQQQREILSRGQFPMGYFSEQNTLLNSRYLEQVIGAMGQDQARGMPDVFLGLHVRLAELGLLGEEHSRFLSDPAARVVTSVHGQRTTFGPGDVARALRPNHDGQGRITGWEIVSPGRTLRHFGIAAKHGMVIRKDRNMTFRPIQFLRVSGAMG